MARIRSIKPSFFKNEDLAELSFAHRLCFAGLWGQADREGRLEDRPRRLKAEIFPYDDIDMDSLLSALAEKQFIVRYAADGVAAIAINGFLKHQRPKSDEPASLIASPLLEHPRGIGAVPRIGKDRGQGSVAPTRRPPLCGLKNFRNSGIPRRTRRFLAVGISRRSAGNT